MDTSINAANNSGAPSPDAIKSALGHLLSEGKLKLSERNRQFLSFVVSEALAGRGERIKAYTIAVEVFGRGSDFDPTNDPIVRIEATRLRSALSTYYEHVQHDVHVRIVIPPGGYVPRFLFVNHTADQDAEQSKFERELPCGVKPFVILDTQTDKTNCRATTRASLLLASIVARRKDSQLRLFLAPSRESKGAAKVMNRIMNQSERVYACDVSVHAISASFRYSWVFTDAGTGEIIGSEVMDKFEDAMDLPAIDEIAERVVSTIRSAPFRRPRYV